MTRLPEKSSAETSALHALLDEVTLVHVGLTTEAGPLVVPTACARMDNALVIHGSTGSGWMRRLASGVPACATVTALDALVVARSAFESSYQYRSAVVFGSFRRLAGDEMTAALDAIVESLVPGRLGEVRPSTDKELAATFAKASPCQGPLRV
jgi:nitroimidazol reductase NimA-like FMN-containing flavoprotein (pyridoxamine 5'-phosphate oxidase superfamily)